MDYTTEAKTIAVTAYRDEQGRPCCAGNFGTGAVCSFYRAQNFGTHETCIFAEQTDRRAERLERRGETGSLIPHRNCPIWSEEEVRPSVKAPTADVEDTVRRILAGYTDFIASEIELSHSLRDDLGLDSLDEIQIVIDIEEEFGLLFEDWESGSVSTVGDIIEVIHKKRYTARRWTVTICDPANGLITCRKNWQTPFNMPSV
jgi:acyl carrier protein